MSKLSRIFQNLFGANGAQSHFGQFGSRAIGAPVFTKDPASIQAISAFITNGWFDAINAGNKAAFLEDMNSLFYLAFYQICYGFQSGIPEWDPSTAYFTGSIVRKAGTTELYGSLIDNNTGNTLPSQTDNGSWHYLNPASVSPGIIVPVGGASAPFGYLLCDGSSYAQASYASLSAYLGSTWNTYRGAADPGAGNFRVPDLRGQTLIGAGTAPGLTARSLAAFVGEETHVLVTGEIPAHNHPVTDPTHAHTMSANDIGALPGGGTKFASAGGADSYPTAASLTGISVGNTGGGGAHNNMQPSAVINWAIKY